MEPLNPERSTTSSAEGDGDADGRRDQVVTAEGRTTTVTDAPPLGGGMAPPRGEEGETGEDPVTSDSRRGGSPVPLSLPLVLVAALTAVAAAVHFALVPAHAAEWQLEGVLFGVVGWSQLMLAAWLVARPNRSALGWTALVNAAVLVTYAWTRIDGFPFGSLKSLPADSVRWLDGLTAVVEVLAVLIAVVYLSREKQPEGLSSARAVAVGVGFAAVLGGAAAGLLASPQGQHQHGGHSDGHSDGHADDHSTMGSTPTTSGG